MTESLTDAARRIAKRIHRGSGGANVENAAGRVLAAELPNLIAAHASRPTLAIGVLAAEIGLLCGVDSDTLHSVRELLRRHATDVPQWVRIPETTTPGQFVVPKAGHYFIKLGINPDWEFDRMRLIEGHTFSSDVTAVRLWNPLDGSTGPSIERQTITTREWTAESVAACVDAWVVVTDAPSWNTIRFMAFGGTRTAQEWATLFADHSVTTYYAVPEPTND